MRNGVVAIVGLFVSLGISAQQKVQIKLCEEMVEFKEGAHYSVVADLDTMTVPQLGETKFVNPLNIAGSNGAYDKSDTSTVTLIIENYHYRYSMQIDRKDLFCGYLGICTEQAKYNKKLTRYTYMNCESLKNMGYAELVRKKR